TGTSTPAASASQGTRRSTRPPPPFSAIRDEYAWETMLVALAKPTKVSAITPRTAPPRGIIHMVGSSEDSARAAKAPTTAATTDVRNRPSMFGQNADRELRVSRARFPTCGHHANPPAMLSSTANMKFTCSSPVGASGGIAVNSDQDVWVKINVSIPSGTMTNPGATIRLTHSTEMAPRDSTTQTKTTAASEIKLTTVPELESSVSST